MLTERLRMRLSRLFPQEVVFNVPLAPYTSLSIGGPADALVQPDSVEKLKILLKLLREEGISYLPIGNGTNLLVRDGGYRGVALLLSRLQAADIQNHRALGEAGVSLSTLINLTLEKGLSGLEFCAGIPGTLGGAIRMNAGAFGREMKDVLQDVTIMTEEGNLIKMDRRDLSFVYRRLLLPPGALIVSATLSLSPGDKGAIRDRIRQFLEERGKKQPLGYRSAGSVFKNPPSIPAGKLIEELGLKGLRMGDAMISERHGNFIINLGTAKASDFLRLVALVKEKALKERGIFLEEEVEIVGEDEETF